MEREILCWNGVAMPQGVTHPALAEKISLEVLATRALKDMRQITRMEDVPMSQAGWGNGSLHAGAGPMVYAEAAQQVTQAGHEPALKSNLRDLYSNLEALEHRVQQIENAKLRLAPTVAHLQEKTAEQVRSTPTPDSPFIMHMQHLVNRVELLNAQCERLCQEFDSLV